MICVHPSYFLAGLLITYEQPASDLLGSYYYQSLESIRDEESTSLSSRSRARTIVRRLLAVGLVCTVLVAGVTCRFTIVHSNDFGNSTAAPWHNVTDDSWSDRENVVLWTVSPLLTIWPRIDTARIPVVRLYIPDNVYFMLEWPWVFRLNIRTHGTLTEITESSTISQNPN